MSDVLKDISSASQTYKVNFIYNELEDFTVTTELHNDGTLEAIRKVIGFYPIRMTVDSTMVFVECINKAKHKFTGRIVNEKGQPLQFANIALMATPDSVFITGGVSNENGDFVIPCEQHQVWAKVTFVGYKTLVQKLSKSDVGIIILKPDSYNLRTLTVDGIRRTDHVDRSVYTFSTEQIKQSRHSCDLLNTVPGLITDPQSGNVKLLSGGSVKLLLNGVSASEKDLRLIPADKVKNVVYYHFAPTKYADSGSTVINVVTHRLDDGYALDLGANSAFTTGFANAGIGARYNRGFNQVALNYNINVRNYNNWQGRESYQFTRADGSSANYTYSDNTNFGYTDNSIQAKFLRAIDNNYVLQVALNTNLSHRFNNKDINIDARGDSRWTSGHGKKESNTDLTNPSLDFYFSKQLPRNQELSINVVGTHYNNSQDISNKQFSAPDDVSILDDRQDQSNKKNSIIGDFNYSKQWNDGKYNFNIRFLTIYSHSNSVLSNLLSDYNEYQYWSNSSYNALFADFSSVIAGWNYRIGGKVVRAGNSNVDNSQSCVQASPTLILSRNFNKHNNMRISIQSWVQTPSIGQLSTNASQIIPGLISQGNQFLKSAKVYSAGVSHNYYTNSLSVSTWSSVQYTDRPMFRYYEWRNIKGEDNIVQSYENARHSWNASLNVQIYFKPFGNELLTLSLQPAVSYANTSSALTGVHDKWDFPIVYAVAMRKGDFGISYRGGYSGWNLGGTYLSKNENMSDLTAFWQRRNMRVTAQCIWLFTRSKYASKLLPNNVIDWNEHHQINDNASMFTLGFTWNFFSGKRINANKKLNNADHDNGLL